MNWRPILALVVRFAAITLAAQIETIFVCSHWFWTPIQRHYLPAYIWCSLPVITPATAEVRVVWKTKAHRKWELAANGDAVDSEGGIGIKRMCMYHFRITVAFCSLRDGSLKLFVLCGEPAGIRTQDPRLKRALLYQLSYELTAIPG